MKTPLSRKGRTLLLIGLLLPLLALFVYVLMRAGPLAPVPVTVAKVGNKAVRPMLFGIGTIEARHAHKIGPMAASRLGRLDVQVGDRVAAGQILGEMDPVDLDARLQAQSAARQRAAASAQAAEAQVREAAARKAQAEAQARRYRQLAESRFVSEEVAEAKRQELQVAEAGLAAARANHDAARQELARTQADREAVSHQRASLRLVAPLDGLVTARNADPGTTLVAGQAVVEVVDPHSLWINVRFDQLRTAGLQAGLPAQIKLRSQGDRLIPGKVLRVEPRADAVTEETLVKVTFDAMPTPLPPIGELAEVTVAMAPQPAQPVVPVASVQRVDGQLGVWAVHDGSLRFKPVKLGAADLDGQVQILQGLQSGEQVVVYSQRLLNTRSRIEVVERLPGLEP